MKLPVLLVGNFLSSSIGGRGVCEELAARLSASGWPVITTSQRPERLPRLLDMVGTTWQRRRQYAVVQVDVYSGLAHCWAEVVCWVLQRARKPYVLTLHGGNLPAFARQRPRRVRRLLCSAAVVTTPSRYLLEQMRPYREDLRLLPNPIDVKSYRFRLRKHPRPRLIWLRSFHTIYNPSLAPKVVALLAEEFPDLQLTMVGPDKGDGSLGVTQEMAERLGISGRITLTGGVTKAEVADWMNQGDVFLNTTNVDNAPVSVLEAMACGLCVVSTNVGGIPYLVEHNREALLVPPDDPEAMAAAVRQILTNPGLAERLSRQAREKAAQFDWSVILPQWEALLSAVAAGPEA